MGEIFDLTAMLHPDLYRRQQQAALLRGGAPLLGPTGMPLMEGAGAPAPAPVGPTPTPARPMQPAPPIAAAGGLPRATGRASPPPAPAPGAAPPGYDQQAMDAYARADEARARAMGALSPTPEAMEQGRRHALGQTLAGLGMSLGGEEFAPTGRAMVAGGMKGFDELAPNPFKQAEIEARKLEAEATAWERRAQLAQSLGEKRYAAEQAAELRREQQQWQRQMQAAQLAMRADQLAFQRSQAEQGSTQVVTDPVSGQSMLVNKKTGEARPITAPGQGEGAGKPGGQYPAQPSIKATQDERQSASQVQRIINSAKLATPGGQQPTAAEWAAGAIPGRAGEEAQRWMRPGERQATYQSQADIVDALLWLSTGAAYNKEQLAIMRDAYMPQFADKPEAAAAKRQRLLGAIQSAKQRAGRAWTQEAEDAIMQAFPDLGGGAPPAQAPRPEGRRSSPRGTRTPADLERQYGG